MEVDTNPKFDAETKTVRAVAFAGAAPGATGGANGLSGEGIGKRKRGFFGKCWWLIRWPLGIILLPLLGYLLLAIGGAWIPDNRDFVPTPNGIEVYFYSNDIHSDIILPLVNQQKDWRQNFPLASFSSARTDFTHVSIGWGSREFYINTPTWNDLDIFTAARVLLMGDQAVTHVELLRLRPVVSSSLMKTKISQEQYQQLVSFVEASIAQTGDGALPEPIADVGYSDRDLFFPAVGRYHLFQTCNCWTGNAMRAAGIKVGKFTPLPKSVFWHLTP